MIKIRVFQESERMTVASILIKNGYRVCQGKEKRVGKKNLDYILLVEDVRDENGGESE